jgi:UDP-glucose 4-epimerase
MRVLLTGGAGFIGSHLAERCLDNGWEVLILDDLSTGCEVNIAHLCKRSGCSFRQSSVLDKRLLREAIDSCDIVFHLAAIVGVRLVLGNPTAVMRVNALGTINVLECAARESKRTILASTSEVYAMSSEREAHEDAALVLGAPSKGRWSYAYSKSLAEASCFAYFREFGVPVTVARLFNCVGPRQSGRYGMVLPTFIRQALAEEPLTIFGNGQQTRSFTYVGDVVEALLLLCLSTRAVGQIFNIGTPWSISINALAAMVVSATKSNSRIEHLDPRTIYGDEYEDAPRPRPCLEKIEQLVGYRPATPVEWVIETIVREERQSAGTSLASR